jgi:hypothetical protein
MRTNRDPARCFWTWWFRWQRRGFDRSTAGYLAWRMAGMSSDWLERETGYNAYCSYNNGPMPLWSYLKPRHNPENTYRIWRAGLPLPLPLPRTTP